MKPRLTHDRPEDYRQRFLKMKTVLVDRATGLPAFPLLIDRLRTQLDTRSRIGVLHVEIVNLDLVESLYGWQVFDRIVSHAASTLRRTPGSELPSDTLLALNRVAGERFVLFLPDRSPGVEVDAAYLAESAALLCGVLAARFDCDEFAGLNPPLQFRVGHALLSENSFFRFDRCVYAAIAEARDGHEKQERRRERTWEEELREILRQGSIETLFQPIVGLESEEVLGFEALSRGPRDTLFEMPRPLFEMSERTGTIGELDRLCVETALRTFCSDLHQRKVFLNILPESLLETTNNGVGAWLEGFDLEPGDLVFEISERGASAGPASLAAGLAEIRRHGCRLALDDVGTGDASLRTIEELRPDYLKLDASMIRGIDSNLIKQEILRTLVQLAAHIDATVIAEAVESREEADTLVRAGATHGQGFLFAVPASAGTIRRGHRHEGPV